MSIFKSAHIAFRKVILITQSTAQAEDGKPVIWVHKQHLLRLIILRVPTKAEFKIHIYFHLQILDFKEEIWDWKGEDCTEDSGPERLWTEHLMKNWTKLMEA